MPTRLLVLLTVLLGFLVVPGVSRAATTTVHGVNWADPRDNFTDDAVVPTGLSTSDSFATTATKAGRILDGFRTDLGATTVRLPVNPPSVGTTWWNSYTGAIDAAVARGYTVILSYWEANSSRDGKVDNSTSYYAMWKTVVSRYGTTANVLFEPMNEPHGYSYTDWSAICATWLSTFSSVPRARVILSGTGYNQDVTGLGADSRFTGTLLSVHLYQFFSGNTTYAQFKAQLAGEVGAYASRTILDEWGAPMTTGTDYHQANSTNTVVAYLQASSDFTHENNMGTVYWPGLRTADAYAMETWTGTSLVDNNSSGRDLLLASWGVDGARTGTITGLAGKCLDTAANGTASPKVVVTTCAGRRWTLRGGALTIDGRCADAAGGGTTNGTLIIAYTCTGAANQHWVLAGSRLRNGGACLDVPSATTTNGTQLELYTCNGGGNQAWALSP